MYEIQYGQHEITTRQFETMAEFSTLKIIGGKISTATNSLPQIVTMLPEVIPVKKLGEMMTRAPWYPLKVANDEILLELDEQSVPKRDTVFRKLSQKQHNTSPWDMTTIMSVEMGNLLRILQEVMKLWNLDSLSFYLQLEDILREHTNSHNNHTMKQIY